MDKKGASAGLVIGLVGGVAFLVVSLVIAFAVVGTLGGTGIIPQTTYTVTNESDLTGAIASANQTGYSLNGTTYIRPSGYKITSVWAEYYQSNGSSGYNDIGTFGGYNVSLAASNYSLNTNTSGNLSSGLPATYNFPNVSVSYTFIADGSLNIVASNLTSNFSKGAEKVADKIPTVLLVGAIILILGIIAVLIAIFRKVRGGSSTEI